MKKPILLVLCIFTCIVWANAQHQISGKVTDASTGQPMPFVSVAVEGTTAGVNTADDGTYTLTVPQGGTRVQFSFVGYTTLYENINNRTIIDASLQPEATSLDQVVVVGFGTQKKVNLTGSVAQISTKELESRPITTISSALQGQMPGVTVVQGSGKPGGDGGTIRIRGVGTMGNSNPLIIVDGLEAKMDDINPNDIANISVLKDAAAAAIYGARAANGVVLITTKRGKEGVAKVTYNGYFGWQSATDKPKMINSYEWAKMKNAALINDGASPEYTDAQLEKFRTGTEDGYGTTDWMGLLFDGSGFQHSHTLSLTGGNEGTRYMVSLGYLDQKGITIGSQFRRYNARLNLDTKVSKLLSVGANVATSYSYTEEPNNPYTSDFSQIFRATYRTPPNVPYKYSEANGGGYGKWGDGNPIAWIEQGGSNKIHTPYLNGSTFADLHIIEGLTLRGVAGAVYNFADRKRHGLPITYNDGSVQGQNNVRDFQDRYLRTTLQALLTYERTFAENHNVNALLGVSQERFDRKLNEGFRENQPSGDLNQINPGSATNQEAKGYEIQSRQGSVFGRVAYNYKEKYFVEANLRHDGSSRFASGHRWGTFPSFSAAWRLSEENFMANLKPVISNLKLRASWGQLGNDRIDDYKYIATIASGQDYPFFGSITSGNIQTAGANAVLTWETATALNVALDADLFTNKLNFSIEWYKRDTKDILVDVPVSGIYGLTAPTVNAGEMRNTGIEIQLNWRDYIGKDFRYQIGANFAYNKNEVTNFPKPAYGETIKAKGYSWDGYYGYEVAGMYETQEQIANLPSMGANRVLGDFYYKDQLTVDTNGDGKPDAGDGKINGDDRVFLGQKEPKYTINFNLGASWKGFDFSAMFQSAIGAYRKHHDEAFWGLQYGAAAQEKHLDYWTPTNKGAVYPAPHVNRNNNWNVNSFSVLKSNYLRLKNLQVGYTLPQSVLSYLRIERVRVYFSGQNLWTIKGSLLEGLDPEVHNANYTYPNVKTYSFGLDITF